MAQQNHQKVDHFDVSKPTQDRQSNAQADSHVGQSRCRQPICLFIAECATHAGSWIPSAVAATRENSSLAGKKPVFCSGTPDP